jgi:hypothetical protein
VIHLYALAGRPAEVDGLVGVDGAPLRSIPAAPLHAVVSDHEGVPRATRTRALAHAEATLQVCQLAPATPARYGAHHADEAALRSALAERAEDLLASVRRVGGRLEVVVRFERRPDPVPASAVGGPASATPRTRGDEDGAASGEGAGRAYLEGRLERERAEQETRRVAADGLRGRTAVLDEDAVGIIERDGAQGPERCLLVPAGRADAVVATAHALADGEPRIVVGGPWPPYTFA